VPDERGFSLVEILIAVQIMGAVMVVFGTALFTMIGSSDYARRTTLAETELRRFADAVRAAPYQPCAGVVTADPSTSYGAADQYASTWNPPVGAKPAPAGMSDDAPQISYWEPPQTGQTLLGKIDTFKPISGVGSVNAALGTSYCDTTTNTGGDTCVQKISLTVRTTQGAPPIVLSTDVYKRSLETDVEPGRGCGA
jgi:type II secretory pathway pseudopilin PulG